MGIWHDVAGSQVVTTHPLALDVEQQRFMNDIVGELLEQAGYQSYVVDASGDVRVRGGDETIGLENPYGAIWLGQCYRCCKES